jgi:phosphate starvation-inducible PhoH-like protein
MVITGDVTQVDLPNYAKSGLAVVQNVLTGVEDIVFMHLGSEDVVRNRLVGDIVEAYGRFDQVQPQDGKSDGYRTFKRI